MLSNGIWKTAFITSISALSTRWKVGTSLLTEHRLYLLVSILLNMVAPGFEPMPVVGLGGKRANHWATKAIFNPVTGPAKCIYNAVIHRLSTHKHYIIFMYSTCIKYKTDLDAKHHTQRKWVTHMLPLRN